MTKKDKWEVAKRIVYVTNEAVNAKRALERVIELLDEMQDIFMKFQEEDKND